MKRISILVAVVLVFGTILTACGQPAPATPAAPAEQTDAPAPAGQKTIIEFWTSDNKLTLRSTSASSRSKKRG